MGKTLHFEYYRQFKDIESKLKEADKWIKSISIDDPRIPEAERRINNMIDEASKLYLLIYP